MEDILRGFGFGGNMEEDDEEDMPRRRDVRGVLCACGLTLSALPSRAARTSRCRSRWTLWRR